LRRGDYIDPEKSPRPHLILLDPLLPKIDGLEVLNKIKDNDKLISIPVVILTTTDTENEIAAIYDNHVCTYLMKPVDFDRFTQLMNDLGFYWLGWSRKPDALIEK